MYRLYLVNYRETSSSHQVKSCVVVASSVPEVITLLPSTYFIMDISSSTKIDFHPYQ